MMALGETFLGLLILFLLFFPVIHVFYSPRTYGSSRLKWLIAIVFLSWFAYLAFLVVTQPVNYDEEEKW
jgi:ABC-type Na+ efflux pump permease subunit